MVITLLQLLTVIYFNLYFLFKSSDCDAYDLKEFDALNKINFDWYNLGDGFILFPTYIYSALGNDTLKRFSNAHMLNVL